MFDEKMGLIDGEHRTHLAKSGIHELVRRVNGSLPGGEKLLTDGDLPGAVRKLVEKSNVLAEQLLKCSCVPVQMGVEYVQVQAQLAVAALPLLQVELARREESVREALAALRQNLVGKGGPMVAAGADVLLRSVNLTSEIEREAQLQAWRFMFAMVRDVAVQKTVPRWLAILVSRHEANRAGQLVTSG